MTPAERIRLEHAPLPHWQGGTRYFHIAQSPPFVVSRIGRYVHRVRSAQLLVNSESYLAIRCWCGYSILSSERKNGSRGRFLESPDDRPICATCEGRAIGAGLLGAREIAGRAVMFSPRINR